VIVRNIEGMNQLNQTDQWYQLRQAAGCLDASPAELKPRNLAREPWSWSLACACSITTTTTRPYGWLV